MTFDLLPHTVNRPYTVLALGFCLCPYPNNRVGSVENLECFSSVFVMLYTLHFELHSRLLGDFLDEIKQKKNGVFY